MTRASATLHGIYEQSPAWLQHIAVSWTGRALHKARYAGDFASLLAAYEERAALTGEQFIEYSRQRRDEFFRFAAEHSPYYRALLQFAEAGSPGAAFSKMPVMNKAAARAHRVAIACNLPGRRRTTIATSGTTGAGLTIPITQTALREQWAVCWRYRRWHGIGQDTWYATFNGRPIVAANSCRPPFWRYNLGGRQILFSAFHMSEANLPSYVAELRRRRLAWLHGYPSALTILASYLLEHGLDLGYVPRWITTSSESLTAAQASLIKRAFGVKPVQHYAMAEGAASFSECQQGALHVDEDYACVEFLPAGAPDAYQVVGTAFTNPAFPLIRYDTGDVVRLSPQTQCPCGRPGRLVASVDGRMEDCVTLRDGSLVGRLDHAFKDQPNVALAQLCQKAAGQLTVRIVRTSSYTQQDEDSIRAALLSRMGDRIALRFEYVYAIAPSRGGKHRFVVSEVPSPLPRQAEGA